MSSLSSPGGLGYHSAAVLHPGCLASSGLPGLALGAGPVWVLSTPVVLKTMGLVGGLGCKPETKCREGDKAEEVQGSIPGSDPHRLSVTLSKLLNPFGLQHPYLYNED